MRLMTSPSLPEAERLLRVVGLVYHVVSDTDPDSETKNSFRSGRSSNVQRMKVFQRLQGEARRGLCQRAAQLGANAILSYAVNFDLEDNMIVARASGSAVFCKVRRLPARSFFRNRNARFEHNTSRCVPQVVMHEDDSSSASSSRHSPLGSPRSKPHNASPSLLPLTLLEPIVEDTMDLKTSVTTEQVQPPPPAAFRLTSPHVTSRHLIIQPFNLPLRASWASQRGPP